MWRHVSVWQVIPLLLTLAGCASGVSSVREAQEHFDRGASIENALRLGTDPRLAGVTTGIDPEFRAANEYRQVRSVLRNAVATQGAQLEQDGLLGTAYTLDLLAAWRLLDLEDGYQSPAAGTGNSYDAVVARSEELLGLEAQGKLQLGTRDRVMLRALPGLLDHDRGLRAADYARADRELASAFDNLERSVGDVSAEHSVHIYIRMAQLQTLRAWQSAYDRHCLDAAEGDGSGCRQDFLTRSGERFASVVQALCHHPALEHDGRRQIETFVKDALKKSGMQQDAILSGCR